MREVSFRLPDGRLLTWYETGRGRPLVLLHGWAMSASVFSEVAPLLAGDFRVLVPDLPGHGKSAPAVKNSLTGIAADLHCWLAAVEPAPVALGGWSLGGMLVLEMARQKRLAVEHMVLIGTSPRFTSGDDWAFGLPSAQVRALSRNLGRRFETSLTDFFNLAFDGEEISAQRLRAIRNFAVKRAPLPDRDAVLALLNELAAQDQRDSLTELDQPALVLHGEQDKITPATAGRFLAEALPNGHYVEFAGVGHGPFLSRPQEIAKQVREFC